MKTISTKSTGRLATLLGGLLLAVQLGAQTPAQPAPEPASQPDSGGKTFRVMTYNIHHAEGLDKRIDLERIAGVIKAQGADIVGLQEVDKGTERTQKRDLPAELAKLTGMTCIFSNNYHYQGGEYGNAILSRFPVKSWSNLHYKTDQKDEPRGAVQAVLEVFGRELVFINTHLNFRPDPAERLSNAAEIKALLGTVYAGKPVILTGDFNDVPDSPAYQAFAEKFTDVWAAVGKGKGFTIPASAPRKRIDFIWLSHGSPLKPLKAWVTPTLASDHLPITAEITF